MNTVKKIITVSFLAAVLSVLFYISGYCAEYDGYIVRFKENAITEANREGTINLCSIVPGMEVVRLDKNIFKISDPDDIKGLSELGLIESCEPNYYYELFYTPSDPYYTTRYQPNMWQIGAESAWNIGCYGNGVKIAIVDSGIYNHDDLIISGGTNTITNTDDYIDTYGHGTVVAGIIGAQFNDIQCAGITPKAEIYAIKCFDGKKTEMQYLIKGIYASVDDFDCDVINMSLGGDHTTELEKAIKYALGKGKIICAAAGNDANTTLNYPAAYDGVIGVGSVNSSNQHSWFSNTNKSVFISAPGEIVRTLTFDGAEKMNLGTSFSCPHVSAAAAIAKNIKPDITYTEFADSLKNSAIDLGDEGYDETFGYGLLNIDGLVFDLLQNKMFFVSPTTTWSDSDTRYTLYNNSLNTIDYIELQKSETDKLFDFGSLGAKTSKEINIEYDKKGNDIFIINRNDLRPLASQHNKAAG